MRPLPKTTPDPSARPHVSHFREQHHEPEATHCATPGCGRSIAPVGEDRQHRVGGSLRALPQGLPMLPTPAQEPVEPRILDGGFPAAGLVARTLISRFVSCRNTRKRRSTPAQTCMRHPQHWLSRRSRYCRSGTFGHRIHTAVRPGNGPNAARKSRPPRLRRFPDKMRTALNRSPSLSRAITKPSFGQSSD